MRFIKVHRLGGKQWARDSSAEYDVRMLIYTSLSYPSFAISLACTLFRAFSQQSSLCINDRETSRISLSLSLDSNIQISYAWSWCDDDIWEGASLLNVITKLNERYSILPKCMIAIFTMNWTLSFSPPRARWKSYLFPATHFHIQSFLNAALYYLNKHQLLSFS